MTKSKRVEILEKGVALTSGDRNQSYGDPFINLTCYAQMVDAYLRGKGWEGEALNAVDGSILMNLAKVSRVAINQQHDDNYVDGATYFAIAGECADRLKAKGGVEIITNQRCLFCHTDGDFRCDDKLMYCLECGAAVQKPRLRQEVCDEP